MKLWEAEHPYYCNEGNYYKPGLIQEFDSWRAFVNEEGDADEDLNLVFRWDWKLGDSDDHELQICWMTQRKGYYRSTLVKVKPDDEPEVRKWLLARYKHLLDLWAPLKPEDIPDGATYNDLHAQVKDLGDVSYWQDGAGNVKRVRNSGKGLEDEA